MLTNEKDVLERWREYFQELLNKGNLHEQNTTNYLTADPKLDNPTVTEIASVINSLKNNKPQGTIQLLPN